MATNEPRAGAASSRAVFDWFDQAAYESRLCSLSARWGLPVYPVTMTDSTNDLALSAVGGDQPSGTVWIAHEQASGRGRRGNHWLSKPGESLLTSLLVRWQGPTECMRGLTLAAGLAVRSVAADTTDHEVAIKWPNDVLCASRKLAGILVESRTRASMTHVVIGIGLNVSGREFEEGTGRPTSLALLGASDLELHLLLAEVVSKLEAEVMRLLRGGLSATVAAARQHDALAGKHLELVDAQLRGSNDVPRTLAGIGCGLSDDGALLVRVSSGQLMAVESAHVALVG